MQPEIDKKDRMILDLLARDGRMSCSDIGRRVGLSRTAVKNRMTALQARGILRGFHAVIRLPEQQAFLVRIAAAPAALGAVRGALAASPEAETVVQLTGEFQFAAVCRAGDGAALRDYLDRLCTAAPGIRRIRACAITGTVKGLLRCTDPIPVVRANDNRRTNPPAHGADRGARPD